MKYIWMIGLVLLLTSCAHTEHVKIGIVTPMSGDAAFIGENAVRSAELTKEYYDLPLDFVIEDVPCGGHGKDAVTVASKLVDVDHVQFVLAIACSDEMLASAPVYNEKHVVFMTQSTGGQNIDEAGEYIFRNGPSDIIAGTKPAEQMYNDFGVRKIALIVDQAEYTLDIAKHFKKTYEGEIVLEEQVPIGEKDLRIIVTKIKEVNADAIFVLTQDGVSAAYLMKQLAEFNVHLPVFANFMANTPHLEQVSREAKEGMYIYDPEYGEDIEEVHAFFDAYEAKYGEAPTIPFHTAGVRDAILMFVEAEQKVGDDGKAIHDWLLENIQGWQGFNGDVSFDKQGNSGTGFVLKQIQNGELVLIE